MPYYPLRPNFLMPHTDRDRAIMKLYHDAGHLWEAPPSQRAVEARKYLNKLLAEDWDVRKCHEELRDYFDQPNAEERMYKEVFVPGVLRQHAIGNWEEHLRFSDIDFRPWVYYSKGELHQQFKQGGYQTIAFLWLFWMTIGHLNRRVPFRTFPYTQKVIVQGARMARRYYGKALPPLETTPMHTRNQLTKRAVVQKMVRDGRAHRIHYEDPLMSTRSRPSGPLDGWSEQGWLGRNLEFLWRDTTVLKREQQASKSWMSV